MTFCDNINDKDDCIYEVADEDLDVQPEVQLEAYERYQSHCSIGPDEVCFSGSGSPNIPKSVPWAISWTTLVSAIRGLQRPTFWEMFAGMAVLTSSFEALGISCAPPIDVAYKPEFQHAGAGVPGLSSG